MKMNVEINDFKVPDFITLKHNVKPREQGFQQMTSIPLSDLDAETLSELCQKFKENVFLKANKPLI